MELTRDDLFISYDDKAKDYMVDHDDYPMLYVVHTDKEKAIEMFFNRVLVYEKRKASKLWRLHDWTVSMLLRLNSCIHDFLIKRITLHMDGMDIVIDEWAV